MTVLSTTRKFDFGRDLLKIIAISTMVVDHIGKILYPNIVFLQAIGRLAFPLFAYLVVLGIESTKKPLNYMATLLLFAVISQVPYFLAFGIQLFDRLNILFSLLLSALTIYYYKKRNILAFIPLLLSIILMTEGSYYVVLTAVCMKILNDSPKIGVLALVALNLQFLFMPDLESQIQILALLALPLVFLHTKNWLKKEILIPENSLAYVIRKYFFYMFYPLHLAFLFLINLFLF